MNPVPSGVRVWLATRHTDMRKGFGGLSLLVQETLRRDPHSSNLFVFRGRRGDLIKVLWHHGQGLCLFSKRIDRGRFLWPSPADSTRGHRLAQSPADLASNRCRMSIKALPCNRFVAHSKRGKSPLSAFRQSR